MKSRSGLATGHGAGAVQAPGHDHGTSEKWEKNLHRICYMSAWLRLGSRDVGPVRVISNDDAQVSSSVEMSSRKASYCRDRKENAVIV